MDKETAMALQERLARIDQVAPDIIDQEITFNGLTFEVSAGVFNPSKGKSARKMIRALSLVSPSEDARILEIGTGSGILAMLLWMRGCQRLIVTDIMAEARSNAQRNFQRLGFEIPVLDGDLFSNVDGTFDYIIFNAPATHPARLNATTGRTTLWDPEGNLKGRFVSELRHRQPQGHLRVLFMYSRYHDFDPLNNIDFSGFDVSYLLVDKDDISESGVILLSRN